MKYEKECTTTSDAVCTCDEGYRCSKSKCDMCVKIPTTTATPALTRPPPPPTTGNVWISVSLRFAGVCVRVRFSCFLLTSRHAQTCGGIMSASADMKYEKECTITSDAVCTCDEGYRCSKSKCDMCVKIPTTTATPALTRPPPPPTTANVWISVSLCFASVCVCIRFSRFLLTSRHAQTCGWIMSASAGFWSNEKNNSRASQCTEEEEVPMPVQEVCGIEKLEDV